MKLTDRMNRLLYPLMKRYVMRAYVRKNRLVERKHPELFSPVDVELSEKHKQLWSKLGVKCGDRWLRLHVNLTGIKDYTFCPEDVFFACVERVLNDCDNNGHGPDDKSILYHFVPSVNCPETVLRYVRGNFFDANLNWLSREEAASLLRGGEFVGKPCRSSGGHGVELRNDFTVNWIERVGGGGYEVQKKIEQSDFTSQFNKSSVNTIRMMTLRCPWDGKIVVCRSMLRMGVSESVVDNMMRGGLCVCVDGLGRFSKYAYDYSGKRFTEHPVSGVKFEGMIHPGYDKMVEVATAIHRRILSYNLLSFDLVQRKDETICVVEINATSQGITQLQYDFGGLFGKCTEQVVDWCAKHLHLDTFNHFRTWY